MAPNCREIGCFVLLDDPLIEFSPHRAFCSYFPGPGRRDSSWELISKQLIFTTDANCHQKGPELGEEFSNIFQLHLVTQRFSCNYNRRPFLTIQDWGGASCAPPEPSPCVWVRLWRRWCTPHRLDGGSTCFDPRLSRFDSDMYTYMY